MEYRKNSYTPRERVDDNMLLRILEEEEPVRCTYGSPCSNRGAVRHEDVRRTSPRNENSDNCCNCDEKCAKQNALSGYALAMVYTPEQEWRELYTEEDALSHGTLFTELCKPFYHGCSGSCR